MLFTIFPFSLGFFSVFFASNQIKNSCYTNCILIYSYRKIFKTEKWSLKFSCIFRWCHKESAKFFHSNSKILIISNKIILKQFNSSLFKYETELTLWSFLLNYYSFRSHSQSSIIFLVKVCNRLKKLLFLITQMM